MAYYKKNKRRFDPRYFMNERLEEDSTQAILNLIKQRIKEVGFGKETEEDFDAAKIELVDDYPDKEDEIDRITFDQFISLNEKGLEEIHISDPEPDWRRPAEGEDDSPEAREKAFHPETIRQRVERSLESFLDKEVEALHHLDAGYEEQEINARNEKFNMREGCGDVEELPWVEIDGGKLTASDDSEQSLADIVRTGQAWKDMGIEIIGGRKDVLSALEVEIAVSEPLPQLMDEEPPLEE